MPAADDWEESCCGLSAFVERVTIMNPPFSIAAILRLPLLLVSLSYSLQAQSPVVNQMLTLQVLEFNKVAIASSAWVEGVLRENAVHPNGHEMEAIARLVWTSNGEEQKITIACVHVLPGIHLTARVGTSSGNREVVHTFIELTDASTYDLLRGLSRTAGGCEVRYSLRTDPAFGRHQQRVVYTVTSG